MPPAEWYYSAQWPACGASRGDHWQVFLPRTLVEAGERGSDFIPVFWDEVHDGDLSVEAAVALASSPQWAPHVVAVRTPVRTASYYRDTQLDEAVELAGTTPVEEVASWRSASAHWPTGAWIVAKFTGQSGGVTRKWGLVITRPKGTSFNTDWTVGICLSDNSRQPYPPLTSFVQGYTVGRPAAAEWKVAAGWEDRATGPTHVSCLESGGHTAYEAAQLAVEILDRASTYQNDYMTLSLRTSSGPQPRCGACGTVMDPYSDHCPCGGEEERR